MSESYNKQFNKPHTTFAQQVDRLVQRGLIVKDIEKAKKQLEIIGYYRLSSYFFFLEEKNNDNSRSHKFKKDATFDDAIRLYVFDQKLRLLVMEAIERIEVALRSSWAHKMSECYGSHPHMDWTLFNDFNEYQESLNLLSRDVSPSRTLSTEIKHYFNNYAIPPLPPIWMVTSSMNFGELIRWIKNTKSSPVKLYVAKSVGIPNIDLFKGVMRNFQTLRNICAHHNRLWDRRFNTKLPLIGKHLISPMVISQNNKTEADNRVYNELLILSHIMLKLSPSSTWTKRIKELVAESLKDNEQAEIGFPRNWKNEKLWF
ncbi:Abi family protein [uncultured Parasutterella sp.]|uniref:Abi family protein n=1 Tax=uncultured Parasutterella sp. TaxID=1263098 RepID=UPI0025B71085|nr:Abi family protein [uncultured Parasutterella sp.]